MPTVGCQPVRQFGWHRRQRHRLGLQFLVSTGRRFESLEEAWLLLALDFAPNSWTWSRSRSGEPVKLSV